MGVGAGQSLCCNHTAHSRSTDLPERSLRASWGGGGWLWLTVGAKELIAEPLGNYFVLFCFVVLINFIHLKF